MEDKIIEHIYEFNFQETRKEYKDNPKLYRKKQKKSRIVTEILFILALVVFIAFTLLISLKEGFRSDVVQIAIFWVIIPLLFVWSSLRVAAYLFQVKSMKFADKGEYEKALKAYKTKELLSFNFYATKNVIKEEKKLQEKQKAREEKQKTKKLNNKDNKK